MSISSDSAEQLIRLYFEGAEFLLKISGSATKNIKKQVKVKLD